MIDRIPLVVQMSHEAGVQVGGIGAVLHGLLSSKTYNEAVGRTVLAGPLHSADSVEMEWLTSPVNRLTIAYSSIHGIFNGVPPEQLDALRHIEQRYGVAVLYGSRRFDRYTHEVLLIDAGSPHVDEANQFKYLCWQQFGLDCARYEWNAEFNFYMALARPMLEALDAIGAGAGLARDERLLLAHEWLSMPLVFAALIGQPEQWRTVFFAHEMATARRLVEERPGHDTSFYNALDKAKEWNVGLESVFGNQDDDCKHALTRLATRCDHILAVGDRVVDELRFLGGRFANASIDVVYNGIPAEPIPIKERLAARERLRSYANNLLGYTPDFVFTHVARMTVSKAIWRDMRVLDHLDRLLEQRGEKAVLFVLSTSHPGGRRPEWVQAWEEQYGWPLQHRNDNGDLLGLEQAFYYDDLEPFNRRAHNVRAVLVNQYGWSQQRCGWRMPVSMQPEDIHRGSDLEFGQSIYEPFGIAQFVGLTYGVLVCLSSVCGGLGFADRAADQGRLAHLIVSDYISLPQGYWLGSPYDALMIDEGVRDWIETNNSIRAAQMIIAKLPRSDEQRLALLESGCAAAQRMSWEVVTRDYLLPALRKVGRRNEA